jgi:pre-rRNA-processing protein TSR1
MGSQPGGHHHRGTTKTSQKSFKSRHATKSELKERSKGRVEGATRQTKHQIVLSKFDRRNRAKQKRLNLQASQAKASLIFNGKDGAPRIVAVIPLCQNVQSAAVVRAVLEAGDLDDLPEDLGSLKIFKQHVERFKQNVAFVTPDRNIWDVLDACRMADYVLFVLDANEEVDSYGEMMLKAAETQGISNVLACTQGLEKIETSKKRTQVLSSLKSYITHFFPALDKINDLSSRQESLNVLRMLCATTPKGVHWREERSWLMVEDVSWVPYADETHPEKVKAILTGVVRGRSLQVDRLVSVGDFGDFQIAKIAAHPQQKNKKTRVESMIVDGQESEITLEEPTEDCDDLNELAPEDVLMNDVDRTAPSMAASERKGVLIDDHHYYSDEDEEYEESKPKRLPRGTSSYQAAWYLNDMDYSGSDMEDVVEDDEMVDFGQQPKDFGDGQTEIVMPDPTEGGKSEYPQSVFMDPSPEQEADQIAEYRKTRREADDDLEFPDEIELHPNVLARERLSRYRGLKNLRTSIWDAEEDKLHEPEEWNRLLEISNYKAAKNRMLKETLTGGVAPGTRVDIYLHNVPLSMVGDMKSKKPLAIYSLLRHEHKRTAVNYSISLSSEVETPLKSKTTLLVQCGPRRFVINPLFSAGGTTPNNVHKFNRYVHPGQTAVASFTGPLTWSTTPLLYFTVPTSTSTPKFIGTGSSLSPSQDRVIAKRIILAGHPFKIHKRSVTIRYMFFNSSDVAWYKALRLWTKRGRSGHFKGSLGTHGYFKAEFDGKLDPMDTIAVSLYKRVWPRTAKRWDGGSEKVEGEEMIVDG